MGRILWPATFQITPLARAHLASSDSQIVFHISDDESRGSRIQNPEFRVECECEYEYEYAHFVIETQLVGRHSSASGVRNSTVPFD